MTHDTISTYSQARNPITVQFTRHEPDIKSTLINFDYHNFPICLVSFEIGVIFHDDSNESEIAFRYAIKRINMYESGFELEPLIRYASSYDSFKTERIGKYVTFSKCGAAVLKHD